MNRASGELWIGTNHLPPSWDSSRSTLEAVRVIDAQIAGIYCHHETLFGVSYYVPEDDPLSLLANTYSGSSIPGRINPDYSPDLDEILGLRKKLTDLGLKIDPVYYFHFAEAYIPIEAESAWAYTNTHEFDLLLQNKTKPVLNKVSPIEIGLSSWAKTKAYLEHAWRISARHSGNSEFPHRWFSAAVFPNSD